MADVPITFVADDPYRDALGGSARWREANSADGRQWRELGFSCPCGCGHFHSIPVRRPDEPDTLRKNAWVWNGSDDKPTLTPSILCRCCECQWHGFLTDGVFRSV